MPAAPTAPAAGPPEHLPEPLSQAEARVLRFLQTSLSAPEIARELYVSVNTVRTHMRHLYDKLGTHRRLEAIDRARTLGLLAPVPHRALTTLPAEGASDKALALFSFPSLAAYEQYRALFGTDPDFIEADRIRDESGCVLRYERTFMRPLLPGHPAG